MANNKKLAKMTQHNESSFWANKFCLVKCGIILIHDVLESDENKSANKLEEKSCIKFTDTF